VAGWGVPSDADDVLPGALAVAGADEADELPLLPLLPQPAASRPHAAIAASTATGRALPTLTAIMSP
jgi:hypothetical protein